MELEDAFNDLMDTEMWIRVGAILAGFMAPAVLKNLLGGAVPDAVDASETYGLAVVVIGHFSPAYATEIQLGGGLATADALAQRFEIKSTIVNMGA